VRVLRGGSWNNNQDNAYAAYRNRNNPNNRNDNIGFRLCCESHIDLALLRLWGYIHSGLTTLLQRRSGSGNVHRLRFAELDASVKGWVNHVRYADSWGLRKHVFSRLAKRPKPSGKKF
jgi:hypothetical protein